MDNNRHVPIMAEVTVLTTNTTKRQQDLLVTSVADNFTRQMSKSSSLVDRSRLVSEDRAGEPTNNQQFDMILSSGTKHYGENVSTVETLADSSTQSTAKTYCYSDEEGDGGEEEDDDALVRGNRLSRRHSSAGIVPFSLRATSPSNAIDMDVLLANDGRAAVSRSASRRYRAEEEQRNQSAIARPALINNNVGNWLNVPGAPLVDIGRKTTKKKNNAITSIEQQIERLELVQTPALVVGAAAACIRKQSQTQRHHHQPNHRPSNCVESSQLLVRHRQSSQHVRSQSVRVVPCRNNNTSPINQQQQQQPKSTFDYGTGVQQQAIGKVRPRGTSLPGTNRTIALTDLGTTTGINADEVMAQQQQYYDKREENEADYYLLRHFIVHGKSNKVVNRGDSFRRSLRAHPKQQNSSAVSQHSSTSSISTENVAGSPPPTQPQQQQYHYHPHQQQGQYYSPYQHYGLTDQGQQQQSSRRASLSLLTVAGVDQQPHAMSAGPSPPSGGPLLEEPYRVLMLGASGVGKTALTAQFMTSEYLNAYEASLDEDTCDRSVSVLLDGEESQLVFIDHPHGEISVGNSVSAYNPHAFVIVYSVVDAESLREVEEVLHFLWRHSLTNNRNCGSSVLSISNSFCGRQRHRTSSVTTLSTTDAPIDQTSPTQTRPAPLQMLPPPIVILVANKIDLVRSRIISPQAGKSLATSFDCKYIETSSGMQHNVDELLVGILKQIRLKIQKTEQTHQQQLISPNSSSSRSLFRKRSGKRRQQQQQHRVNYQTTGVSDVSAEGEGSCCINTSAIPGIATNTTAACQMTTTSANRRSASLRVRRMLGKAVWTCAEYYHRNKSRSCEDLHVL